VSNLPEARSDIELEETQFRASVSESRATKVGSSINFINRRQADTHNFALNGPYGKFNPIQGVDGKFVCYFNLEIIAISFGNDKSGLSGTTEFDIILFDTDGTNLGSIFSTTPKIDFNSSDDAFATRIFLTGVDNTTTGATLPVLDNPDPQDNTLKLNQFQALKFNMNAVMQNGENAWCQIHFRPR
jgi:hypothetical protein